MSDEAEREKVECIECPSPDIMSEENKNTGGEKRDRKTICVTLAESVSSELRSLSEVSGVTVSQLVEMRHSSPKKYFMLTALYLDDERLRLTDYTKEQAVKELEERYKRYAESKGQE